MTTSHDPITIITKLDPLTPVEGRVALLLECARDSNLALANESMGSLRHLIGSTEEAKQKASRLAQKLISGEPGFEGVLQLHVMEEIIIRALEGIFEAIHLDQWLSESGARECRFRVPSPYIERLRSIQAVSGSSYKIVAPPASSVSTAEKVRRRFKNKGLAGIGESFVWGARRYFPNGARWLAAMSNAKRPRERGGWWFYSTAYTFTNIGLAYEPFVPGEMRYLLDSSETGAAPLVERGKPFFDLYAWATRRDLPSKQAVEQHRQKLVEKIKSTALTGEEAIARDALLAAEAFLTYLTRILPLTCFHSRIFNSFLDDMKPEGVVVGNAAFEGPLLQLARNRGIPTVLLQHGILGDYYQLMDQPAETLLVRGQFWKEFVMDKMRSRTQVLNVPYASADSSKRHGSKGHILFLTAVDAALTHTHESDLREIVGRLLKVSKRESRALIIRVHPMETVGYYKNIVEQVSEEIGIRSDVEYSQGAGLEELLQESAVAVMYSSTVFLDCLRLRIPIVSFGWHDFAYKNLVQQHKVFHFAQDLSDLEGLITAGARGTLTVSSDYDRFLASTPKEELESFFRSLTKTSTAQAT